MSGENTQDLGAPGFFGKLPSFGDFVVRGLSRGFVEVWDDWLQKGIASSQEQLGEEWLSIYLTSPIWRFVLSPGVCGQTGWAGVLIPSVDRVGRYFPFTISAATNAECNPFEVVTSAKPWFEGVETLVLAALEEEEIELDALHGDLRELGRVGVDCEGSPGAPAVLPADGAGWRAGLGTVDGVSERLPVLLGGLVARDYGPYSLWTTAGSEHVEPSLLVCGGLPPPESFAALLDGDWSASPWHEVGITRDAALPTPGPEPDESP